MRDIRLISKLGQSLAEYTVTATLLGVGVVGGLVLLFQQMSPTLLTVHTNLSAAEGVSSSTLAQVSSVDAMPSFLTPTYQTLNTQTQFETMDQMIKAVEEQGVVETSRQLIDELEQLSRRLKKTEAINPIQASFFEELVDKGIVVLDIEQAITDTIDDAAVNADVKLTTPAQYAGESTTLARLLRKIRYDSDGQMGLAITQLEEAYQTADQNQVLEDPDVKRRVNRIITSSKLLAGSYANSASRALSLHGKSITLPQKIKFGAIAMLQQLRIDETCDGQHSDSSRKMLDASDGCG